MSNNETISFETGHKYGSDRPYGGFVNDPRNDPNFEDIRDINFHYEMMVGEKIQTFLESCGEKTIRLWFHDNILPKIDQKRSTYDSGRYAMFEGLVKKQVIDLLSIQGREVGGKNGKGKLMIQDEYDLISEAESISIPEIIKSVQNYDNWSFDVEKNTLRGPNIRKEGKKQRQRIRLKGYRKHIDIPSCEALDYTYYKQRLEMSSPTITLIGENMKEQQERVKQLFTLTGEKPEIIVLFHNGENITEGQYWGEGENKDILQDVLEQDF